MRENIIQWVSDYQIVTHSWFTAQIDLSELYVKLLTAGDMNMLKIYQKFWTETSNNLKFPLTNFTQFVLTVKTTTKTALKNFFTQIGNK